MESLDSEISRAFLKTRKVCDRLLTDSSVGSLGEEFHGIQEELFPHDNFAPFLCPASISYAQWTREIENVTIAFAWFWVKNATLMLIPKWHIIRPTA